MGNLATNCNNCDSSKEEGKSELKLIVNGIEEKDPEQRRILIQAKSTFENKLSNILDSFTSLSYQSNSNIKIHSNNTKKYNKFEARGFIKRCWK